MREVLEEHELRGYPKTSGSRGIHIYVRILPEHDFTEVRRAALALARAVERSMPGRATSRWWKEEREGVFIDYNQNARDRTVASAYSVRAVADARVSCPLEWEEVADVDPARAAPGHRPRAPARARRPVGHDRRRSGVASTRCLSWPHATSARASATRPGRRTFASRRTSPGAFSPAAPGASARRPEPAMSLPLQPPLKPQLALSRKELPVGEDYIYEVKLDGFRCLAFVDGEDVYLQSRSAKPLGRYFPELTLPAGRYVLDGEIVVRDARGHEDFDALGQRIHPAASRIERLSVETPAVYVVFDLLALEDESLLERPLSERRDRARASARERRVRRRAASS